MRPCLVINDFNAGGAERLVKDLANELNRLDGVDPVVVVSDPSGALKSEFEESGIELSVLDVGVTLGSVPRATSKLIARLRILEVDVVHSHLAFSDLISRLACTRLSLPHVSTYHNVQEKRSLGKRIVEHATRRLSDRIICVSDGVRQSYGNDDRMCVIYNAIDVEAFDRRVSDADVTAVPKRVRDADTIYLNVGRCVKVKRQWDLIQAVDRMDGDDVHLVIVGDGPLRSELEEIVKQKELSDTVTITGYVENIEPYYAVSDVFVSSSSSEGLPPTHIEAMAAGLPIVSTDIPGVREIVTDGRTGFLCPVDRPDVLAEQMERFEHNSHGDLAARGHETAASTFALDAIVDEYIKVYRNQGGSS